MRGRGDLIASILSSADRSPRYDRSSGKTTLALHVVAEAQRLGGIAAFIDAEHALDPIYANFNVGEQDVQFYMVYRRPTGTTDWGNPATSVAAGSATYRWMDPSAPNLHGTYEYNVIAQDCTPSNSGDAISNSLVLP